MSKRWTEKDLQAHTFRVGVQKGNGVSLQVFRPKYAIGIDCGVSTGIGIWDYLNKELLMVQTVAIHQAMDIVRAWAKDPAFQPLFIRVEDARQRKIIPYENNEKAERGRREGAGSVKRDAKIWEDFLEYLGCRFQMVAPKDNKTKLTAEAFRKLTGFQGKTNEHGRDAAGLVFGF